jgi:chromosome segregation ATPase
MSEVSKLSEEDLKKIADMMVDQAVVPSPKAIIKIENETVPETDTIKRYKRSNKQLRTKVERQISEIAKQEAEIKELQVSAYLNTDEAKDTINKKLREEKQALKLKMEEQGLNFEKERKEIIETRSKIYELERTIGSNKKEIEGLRTEVDQLMNDNRELQAEIDARIKADGRFNIMDL